MRTTFALVFVLVLASFALGYEEKRERGHPIRKNDEEKKTSYKDLAESIINDIRAAKRTQARKSNTDEKKTGEELLAEKPKTVTEQKARKYIEKDVQKKRFQDERSHKKGPKRSSGEVIKDALDKIIESRTKIAMETYVVRVPVTVLSGDKSGQSLVDAKLSSVIRASAAELPTTYVETIDGTVVPVSKARMAEIARKHTKDIRRSVERTVISELMERARSDPLAEEAMIDLMFRRIVHDHPRVAEQKAFSKVEAELGLKTGALYNQYRSGIEKPSVSDDAKLPNKQSSAKTASLAATKSLYSSVNNMDLSSEKDIPESVRLTLNRQLRKDSLKKEKEEEKKTSSLKKFFLGA